MQLSSPLTYFIGLIAILYCSFLNAQNRPSFTEGSQELKEYEEAPEDTVKVRSFTLADIAKTTNFSDTLLDDFEKYASVRTFRDAALTLGNLGSSHQRIIYESRDDILTVPGFMQYKNYQLRLEDFKYYVVGAAFSDLFFSPVAGQENFKVEARFSNNFQNDLNISLDLKRISQEGFYTNQATKSTAFGFGIWKNNKEKNRQTFFTFLANNNNEEHNGGIVAPTPFRVRTQEATKLSDTDGRHQNFKYALDNFFNLKANKYKAHHQIVLEDGYYYYGDNDTQTTQDTLTYKENYVTNARGIRYLMDVFKVKNNFDLSLDTKSFGLKLGISHQYAKYTNDSKITKVNDIIAYSDIDIDVGKFAKLIARGELGLGTNSGNLKLSGNLFLKPVNDLQIQGKLKLVRYDPSLIQESVSVSNIEVFNNDFSKVNELLFGASLTYKKLNLTLELNSGVIDNPISYNSQALPIQKSGSTEYIQALLVHQLRWKFIGIENSVCYQEFTDNIYNLPDLHSIHNIYLEFPMFKKNLLTRVGGLYYFTRMREALEYFPITGSFIPAENGVPAGPTMNKYPYMEAYANFKIKSFRLFVKVENLHDLINPFGGGFPHYQVIDYPQFDWKLRMGLRWVMRN